MNTRRTPLPDRFWPKVDKRGPDSGRTSASRATLTA